jgi:feruloyl esterase
VLSGETFKMIASATSDPNVSWRTFNLGRDLPRLKEITTILSPLDADLRPYKNRGGKVLMYHGWADPAISAYGTIDYYDRMTKVAGGRKAAEEFARLYLVPGMHHCSGGPGPNQFDMLTALENWVEKGAAPHSILAAHATAYQVDRTRPLCPYPQARQIRRRRKRRGDKLQMSSTIVRAPASGSSFSPQSPWLRTMPRAGS